MIYFNDNEPYVVEWLKNLWPDAIVDGRNVEEVQAEDLQGAKRVHLFAGIGGWEYALQLANWPEEVPVWTMSLPCQPFSTAGKRKGINDERHLWPVARNLIEQSSPNIIFGEQVASKDGREWLAGVQTDLEDLGFIFGAADLCAAGVSAPHIRQRLYWVAYPERTSAESWRSTNESREGTGAPSTGSHVESGRCCYARGLGDSDCATKARLGKICIPVESQQETRRCSDANPWSRFELVECADGKARRFEPGSFPLAYGVSTRVGKIRAYGGAIVPQVAQIFIESFLEVMRSAICQQTQPLPGPAQPDCGLRQGPEH